MDSTAPYNQTLALLKDDLEPFNPRAVVVFGSMARLLAGTALDHQPNDIDVMVIGDLLPETIGHKTYPVTCELHRIRTDRIIGIARTLRYDPRPLALIRLYGSVLARRHCIDVIAACLLLGPGYRRFGIEQIEIDGHCDQRDYSIHHVLLGLDWWRQLQAYARCRRGPLKRYSDKLAGTYDFHPARKL